MDGEQMTGKYGLKSIKPSHVAIIMDGNGRWAQQKGLPRLAGIGRGQGGREVIRAAGESEVPFLSLFAFSTEN